MGKGRAPRWLLSIVASAALLAGCTGGSDGGEASEPPARYSFDPIEGMVVRQDQQPITESDAILIFKAEWRLVNQCMAELGFPPTVGPETYAQPHPPPYLSPTELRRSGYQFDYGAEAASRSIPLGPDGPLDPTAGMDATEAERFETAFSGPRGGPEVEVETARGTSSVASQGCGAEAQIELYGSLENSVRYEEAKQWTGGAALRKQLSRSKPYRAAVGEWQQCMAASGFDFPDDFAAGADYGAEILRRKLWIQLDGGGGPLLDEEIDSVAAADATCQESSGLDRLREELLPEARDAVVEELGLDRAELVAFQRAVLEKAKTVS